jgi:hypothetical protein
MNSIKKLRVLLSFIPWVLLAILSKFSVHLAIIVAFLFSLLSFQRLRKGFIIDWGTFLFFLTSLIIIIVFKNMWFGKRIMIFGVGMLALVSWGSILVKYPFTIDYAKLLAPKELWSSYLFIYINKIISTTFAICFSIMVLLQLVKFYYPSFFNPIIFPIIYWGILILNFIFISWFPEWYKKKVNDRSSKNENNLH